MPRTTGGPLCLLAVVCCLVCCCSLVGCVRWWTTCPGGLRETPCHVPLAGCCACSLLLGAVRVAWSAAACWWAACAGGPRALGVLRETPCHVPLAGCSACSVVGCCSCCLVCCCLLVGCVRWWTTCPWGFA